MVGWAARRELPRRWRRPSYAAFARWVGARLDEAELPLDDYPTFASFFARRLRPGIRPIDGGEESVIAPCDGALAATTEVGDGRLLQAKGIDYPLDRLLGDPELAADLEGGLALTFYLSPRDYHRVHAPVAGELTGYRYLPGGLLPVSPRFRREVDQLFVRNERLILPLATRWGQVVLVLVGATGVGNMILGHGGVESRDFRATGRARWVPFEPPPSVARGDELGGFSLGSTVVLIFPPGAARLAHGLESGPIQMGHEVARMHGGRERGQTPGAGGVKQEPGKSARGMSR